MSGPKIKRLYYSMNEVCEISQVGAHTLRQWENKYPLNPAKSQSGRKLYKPSDLEIIKKIKQLTRQGYSETIIHHILDPNDHSYPEEKFISKKGDKSILHEVRQELMEILELLS